MNIYLVNLGEQPTEDWGGGNELEFQFVFANSRGQAKSLCLQAWVKIGYLYRNYYTMPMRTVLVAKDVVGAPTARVLEWEEVTSDMWDNPRVSPCLTWRG